MTHYIVHYIKQKDPSSRNQYERLSEIYNSVKPLVKPLFSFEEGKTMVIFLKDNYPELEFELKPMGD